MTPCFSLVCRPFCIAAGAAATSLAFTSAHAAWVDVTVTVQNLAPINSIRFAAACRLQQRQLRRPQHRQRRYRVNHLGGAKAVPAAPGKRRSALPTRVPPAAPSGADEIWDAGFEVFDPAAAAVVGNNKLRRDQNSVVAFNFAE